MRAGIRLGGFAAVAVTAFGVAFAAGAVTDPIAPAESREEQPHAAMQPGLMQAAVPLASTLAGLSSSDAGYVLRVPAPILPSGQQVLVSLRVEGPDGAPLQQYRAVQEQEMHLILLRRDLSSFQHLHPGRDAGGTWTATADLRAAGTYRLLADFAPAALEGRVVTLGTDVSVPGTFEAADLPAPSALSAGDGYEVALAGSPRAGEDTQLQFSVRQSGVPVTGLVPYPAAAGHLVAVRAGDLAYLRTRPGADAGQGGSTITYATVFPTPGPYRLFLHYGHGGQVRTAEFTLDVAATEAPRAPNAAGAAPAGQPAPPAQAGSGGHEGMVDGMRR